MHWGRYATAIRAAVVLALVLAVVVPSPPTARRVAPRQVASPTSTVPANEPVASELAVAPAEETAPVDVPSELAAEPAAPPAPTPAGPRKIMLIGDSMAYTAALGLAPHSATWDFTVVNEGIMGCGVVRGGPFRYFGAQRDFEARCDAWPAAWQAALDRNRPDMVGIVVGRWELMDRVFEGRWTNIFDPAFAAYLGSEVDRAIVLAMSGGARAVVFTTPYYRRGVTPTGGLFPEDDPARVDAINAILRQAAETRGVPVVDVGGWLSPEGRYTRDVAGVKVRSDGVHLTRQTGELLAPWLFPQLQEIAARPPQAAAV